MSADRIHVAPLTRIDALAEPARTFTEIAHGHRMGLEQSGYSRRMLSWRPFLRLAEDDGLFDAAQTMGVLQARGYSWQLGSSKIRWRLGLPEHVLVISDGERKRVFRGRKMGDVFRDAARLVEVRRPTVRETRWVDRTVPEHRHPGWERDPVESDWAKLFRNVLAAAHLCWCDARRRLRRRDTGWQKDGQVRWLATLNIQQAAAASGLPATAVRRLIRDGRIDAIELDGGHPRIPAVFIHRIANGEL